MEKTRPPIVTVLGHVDHGKTTLLDVIRKTKVAVREAGGITQSIGASQIEIKKGQKITFIDTPGHAIFSEMRARGAKVADLALLVVAADAGVKPQTVEALNYIREVQIPYLLVITKTDLPSADVENVQNQLEKEGVLFEGHGGNVPLVTVSAKKRQGIEELLEMIILLAEVSEIKGSAKSTLDARVIETGKDRRGLLVTAVVRNGTLKVGDEIVVDGQSCKVRGLFNDQAKSRKQALPSEPVLILGFSELPLVGAKIERGDKKAQPLEKVSPSVKVPKVKKDEIPILLKAQSAGSLEALQTSLPPKIVVVAAGVGDVTESDVFLAKSSQAEIIVFEARTPTRVANLADTEGVKIESFKVVYELIKYLEELLETQKQKILGQAQILASFPFNKLKIAGCKMLKGKFSLSDKLTLIHNEKEIGQAKVVSLKKQKEEVKEVKEGEEFGVLLEPQLDFTIGDMLILQR